MHPLFPQTEKSQSVDPDSSGVALSSRPPSSSPRDGAQLEGIMTVNVDAPLPHSWRLALSFPDKFTSTGVPASARRQLQGGSGYSLESSGSCGALITTTGECESAAAATEAVGLKLLALRESLASPAELAASPSLHSLRLTTRGLLRAGECAGALAPPVGESVRALLRRRKTVRSGASKAMLPPWRKRCARAKQSWAAG